MGTYVKRGTKNQEVKYQHISTLSSIASSRAMPSSSRPASIGRKQSPGKFSQDTKRLQDNINIRNSCAPAQIKTVIDHLFKTRKAFTAEPIKEECYVTIDLHANKAVFDSLSNNNSKVHYDRRRFSYKPTHDVKDKSQLRSLVFKYTDWIDVADLKDAYPSVMEDLQALKASGDIFWLISGTISKDGIVYPDGFECPIQVDDDFKALYRDTEVPSDMLDVEKELRKYGLKPATVTAARKAAAQIHGVPINKPKHKKKKKKKKNKRSAREPNSPMFIFPSSCRALTPAVPGTKPHQWMIMGFEI